MDVGPGVLPVHRRLALRQDCESYQLVRSIYSIANGGFPGTGLGKGTFKTPDGGTLIPFVNTDFIYSALAQDSGSSARRRCYSSSCCSSRGG